MGKKAAKRDDTSEVDPTETKEPLAVDEPPKEKKDKKGAIKERSEVKRTALGDSATIKRLLDDAVIDVSGLRAFAPPRPALASLGGVSLSTHPHRHPDALLLRCLGRFC